MIPSIREDAQMTALRLHTAVPVMVIMAVAALAIAPVADYSLLTTTPALVLLGLAIYQLANQARLAVFSPVVVLGGFGVLYALPFALTKLFGGILIDERTFADDHVNIAVWLQALSITSLTVAYLVTRWRPHARVTSLTAQWPRGFIGMFAVIVAFLGVIATFRFLLAGGGTAAFQGQSYAERGLAMRGQGVLLSGMHFFSVAALVAYYDAATHANKRASFILLAAIGLLTLFAVVMGSRGPLLRFILSALAIYSVTGGGLSRTRVVVLGAVLVAATLLHSVVGRNLAIIFDVEWGAVPLFVANPANGEFGSTIPTLADVHANVPDAEPFALGASYLDAIGVTVPRFIWPDRPMAAGEWYAAHFYPERWETGGAYGFSPVAEAYWNFGIFGVLLIPFVFGVALRWWEDQRMVTRRQPNLGTLAYVLAIPWLAFSWRLDAASVVKNYLVLTLIPALALLAAATVARGVASMHRQAIRLSGAT